MGGRGGNDVCPGGRVRRFVLECRRKLLANRLRDRCRRQMAQAIGRVAPGLSGRSTPAGGPGRPRRSAFRSWPESSSRRRRATRPGLGRRDRKARRLARGPCISTWRAFRRRVPIRGARVEKDAADLFDPAIALGFGDRSPGQHPPDTDPVLRLVLKPLQLLKVGLLDALRIVQRQQVLGGMNLDPDVPARRASCARRPRLGPGVPASRSGRRSRQPRRANRHVPDSPRPRRMPRPRRPR